MISKTNGSAIGALVCGLISMLMPVLLSVPAIILGIVGLRAINVSNGVEKGKGMAISGIVLGSLTLLGTILLIIISTASQS
jgi:ABC-type phosphate transport system permease subunit